MDNEDLRLTPSLGPAGEAAADEAPDSKLISRSSSSIESTCSYCRTSSMAPGVSTLVATETRSRTCKQSWSELLSYAQARNTHVSTIMEIQF